MNDSGNGSREEAGSSNDGRALLRQEAGPALRVTGVSPGFVRTDFALSVTDPEVKAQVLARVEEIAIPPDSIARAIAFAIERPDDVDVGDIVVRQAAQA